MARTSVDRTRRRKFLAPDSEDEGKQGDAERYSMDLARATLEHLSVSSMPKKKPKDKSPRTARIKIPKRNLLQLPPWMVIRVLGYCKMQDVCKFGVLNKKALQIERHEDVWYTLTIQQCRKYNLASIRKDERGWRTIYHERHLEFVKWMRDTKKKRQRAFNINVCCRFKPFQSQRTSTTKTFTNEDFKAALNGDKSKQTSFAREREELKLKHQQEEARASKVGKREASILEIEFNRVVTTIQTIGVRPFQFDRVYCGDATQDTVCGIQTKLLAEQIVFGYDVTVFMYGQTGSGKTHTMFGPPGALVELDKNFNYDLCGLVPRVCRDILSYVDIKERVHRKPPANAVPKGPNAYRNSDNLGWWITYSVSVTFVEIYREKIYDLLDDNKEIHLEDRNGSFEFVDCKEEPVTSVRDIITYLKKGNDAKQVSATAMNDRSSRSHTIFILTLNQENNTKKQVIKSRCYLVDLAGSERIKKSKAKGKRLEEAKNINKSLTCLGRCITALVDKDAHVPYRDSSLTKVLQSSLGGNCSTSMIVTCAEDPAQIDESLSSLRFGERTRSVTNFLQLDRRSTASIIKALHLKIKQLKAAVKSMKDNKTQNTDTYATAVRKLKQLKKQELQLRETNERIGL